MNDERLQLAFIGFGEAAMAFCTLWSPEYAPVLRAYDKKTHDPERTDAKRADMARFGVDEAESVEAAVEGMPVVISVVTADEAVETARQAARHLASGALYCDMNSVAPETKRVSAEAIEAGGGRYVDIAVLAPLRDPLANVAMLASGPHVTIAQEALGRFGINLEDAGDEVGRASSIKMIRSAMVKGIEALSAECALAARRAGVTDEVVASLDRSKVWTSWEEKMSYDLGRIMQHGLRRAAEVEEVVKTLDALGTGSAMSRAAVERHRQIGLMRLAHNGDLAAKTTRILEAA